MYCKYCGRQIEDDSKFCEFCGNLVQHTNKVTPTDREPDIPAPIGEPIFKEVVFEQPTPEPEPTPEPAPEPEPTPEPEPEEQPVPEKKPVSKGLIAGLIAGGVALIGLIVLIVVLCTRPKTMEVDAAKYIDFKVSGYDGYGIATCEMDWDGLEVAAFGEYPKGSDSKTRTKQTEYKEKALVLHSAVKLEFTEKKNLSVGDKLSASVSVNTSVEKELGIVFIGKNTAEYTVKQSDLNGSSELDIVKEFLDVSFDGRSGTAQAVIVTPERDKDYAFTTYDGTEYTVSASVKEENTVRLTFTNTEDKTYDTVDIECVPEPSKDLKNGDKVKVKIGDDAKDKLMSAYGLTLAENTTEFEVKDLNTLVTKVSEVEKATLTGWVSKFGPMLEKYVLSNWDNAIHGGNKVVTETKEFKDVTSVKKVLASNDTENAMYLIYTASVLDDGIAIDNSGFPQTYYFAVCLQNLELDSKNKLLTDQVKLPDAKSTDSFLGAYASYDEALAEITMKYSSIDEQ